MALLKRQFPSRDLTKYPNPGDEPLEEQCKRLQVRMPAEGESMLEWGQSDPFSQSPSSKTQGSSSIS